MGATTWLLEVCIMQTIDDFEEFKESHSIDKYRVLLNYETGDLVPTVRIVQIAFIIGYTLLKLNLQIFMQWDVHPETCIGIPLKN